MAGAGEDEAAPPPPPPLDRKRMEASARKLSRLEHHRSVGDDPSFRMENLPELQKLTTRSHGMFTRLRHMTCQLHVRGLPKGDNGVLQLVDCLNITPQLETLHLDMIYFNKKGLMNDEAVEEECSPMHRHDHLKTVYISGFQLYRAQKKLAFCILENAPLLDHMQLEPRFADGGFDKKFVRQVREWAGLTSLRFGKAVIAGRGPFTSSE